MPIYNDISTTQKEQYLAFEEASVYFQDLSMDFVLYEIWKVCSAQWQINIGI